MVIISCSLFSFVLDTDTIKYDDELLVMSIISISSLDEEKVRQEREVIGRTELVGKTPNDFHLLG